MHTTDFYDSEVAEIFWDNNLKVFVFKLKDGTAIYDENEVVKQFDFFKKHAKNNPYKVIVDMRGSHILPTDEAFSKYFSLKDKENKTAIIFDSLPHSLLFKQMFKNKSNPNTHFFKVMEDAIEWILKP